MGHSTRVNHTKKNKTEKPYQGVFINPHPDTIIIPMTAKNIRLTFAIGFSPFESFGLDYMLISGFVKAKTKVRWEVVKTCTLKRKFRDGVSKFRRALRKEDQQVFDQLFEKARLHVEAGGNASRPWPFETILISILLEQEKALAELRSKIEKHEEKEGWGGRNSVWR